MIWLITYCAIEIKSCHFQKSIESILEINIQSEDAAAGLIIDE